MFFFCSCFFLLKDEACVRAEESFCSFTTFETVQGEELAPVKSIDSNPTVAFTVGVPLTVLRL